MLNSITQLMMKNTQPSIMKRKEKVILQNHLALLQEKTVRVMIILVNKKPQID
jgi:hypothetical protein